MKVFGIVHCNSVKKARDFLQSRNIAYEFIDFKKTPPTLEMLEHWIEQKGVEGIINHKGTTYKKLQLKQKKLSPKEAIDYCIQYPTLIKRPVIQTDCVLLFGFDEELYIKELCCEF